MCSFVSRNSELQLFRIRLRYGNRYFPT